MDPAALFYMPLYKAGASVHRGGRRETVSHVVVRRYAMMVYLVGHDEPVRPEDLTVAPSAFTLSRVPESA